MNTHLGDEFVLGAEWTDDCQGKKDYDFNIISLSSRYYPRGGGFHLRKPGQAEWEGNEARPHIPPTAVSSIILRSKGGDYIDLIRKKYRGETQEEVQRQVEAFAEEQYRFLVLLMEAVYREPEYSRKLVPLLSRVGSECTAEEADLLRQEVSRLYGVASDLRLRLKKLEGS